ncbi:probable serine/threonine-protein kinase tsuA [Uranotaenia lowii]|uniref:probable serine/threonine-protein kinase tsuA n=1 Tax=Uranotaenia lowii TaxID=190385 RepID=UPI00247AFE54|nr:probable serine/threonine-protein kinase tsuA [Uranotaenia lowii]
MLEIIANGIMTSSAGMDISESFRPEDLGKTDFFDFVTGSAGGGGGGSSASGSGGGSASEMTVVVNGVGSGVVVPSSAAIVLSDRPPGGGPGGGGGGGAVAVNRNGPEAVNGSSSTASTPTTPTQPGSGSGIVGSSNGSTSNNSSNNGANNQQPLQGFDQFWGPDKDANRLDQSMFDDINRYCWIQQNNGTNHAGAAVENTVTDTDGQIYTLTVLNGAPEPWVLRKEPTATEPPPPASNLDLDTILGGFPGYVKTECYSYDDSGFGTDHHAKDDQSQQQQQQQQQHDLLASQHLHQQVQQIPVTSTNIVLSNSLMDPNSVIAYQNNNNDWQMSDHNVIEHETPESLLRSALQGKGYTKGSPVQLQNGITVIPAGQIKEEELRRVLYPGEAESLGYADSTLVNPLFEDATMHSPNSNHPHHHQSLTPNVGDLGSGVVVDDMFLTLDSAFTEDYEKLKRIATEVQQFCTDNNYTEIIVEPAAINNQQHHNPNNLISSNNGNNNNNLVISSANNTNHHVISTTTSSDVVTTTSTAKVKAPRSSKKYKRSLNNNNNNNSANSSATGNPSIAAAVNNNNNSSMSNLNNTSGSLLNTTSHSSANNPSPTHCNGQRKERSLHYCSICSKGFKDKYSVNVHIRTHTGEKPFACSLCGKSFRQKAHLAKHYQTHMAQKNPSGSVKASKQNRAVAAVDQQQAAAASVILPPPPLAVVSQQQQQQQHQQSQQQQQQPATTSLLLNTATIVAGR